MLVSRSSCIIITIIAICLSVVNSFTSKSNVRSRIPSKLFSSDKPYFIDIVNDGHSKKREDEVRKSIVVAGATGYIGRAVVRESVRRGYNTIALVRSLDKIQNTEEGIRLYGESFAGAKVIQCDVEDPDDLKRVFSSQPVLSVVSCLASPVGTKREAYAIDYQATLNCLNAGREAKASHFILLSAFCVRRPLLQLQQAKLKFEAELQKQNDMTWSIVRPTAFFKSVSGQLEGIQQGNPYVLFGDGAVTRCNPIAESELAEYMLDCINMEDRKNQILNIGGPDSPLTNQMLGEMMYKAIGKEPKFVYAPTWIFDTIINTLQFFADVTKSEKWENAAEYGRIGKYYAVEDMLTVDPKEKYGKISMQDHYNAIASKGQDPFTPVRATALIAKVLEAAPATISIALPVAFASSNPLFVQKIETVMAESSATGQFDFALLLASLSSNFSPSL